MPDIVNFVPAVSASSCSDKDRRDAGCRDDVLILFLSLVPDFLLFLNLIINVYQRA